MVCHSGSRRVTEETDPLRRRCLGLGRWLPPRNCRKTQAPVGFRSTPFGNIRPELAALVQAGKGDDESSSITTNSHVIRSYRREGCYLFMSCTRTHQLLATVFQFYATLKKCRFFTIKNFAQNLAKKSFLKTCYNSKYQKMLILDPINRKC